MGFGRAFHSNECLRHSNRVEASEASKHSVLGKQQSDPGLHGGSMACDYGLGKSAVQNLGCALHRNAREEDDKMFKM